MVEPEFPILGTEPIAVELANTRYAGTDLLSTDALVDAWFAAAAPGPVPAADQVRVLRDDIHHLLTAAIDGHPPDPAAVDRVNTVAAAAPTRLRLDWPPDGPPTARWVDTTTGATAVLGRVATCCVELLGGPRAGDLRRCEGPGCTLLFVRTHPRRRWCHPSCGHRDRQARYYRRQHTTGAT